MKRLIFWQNMLAFHQSATIRTLAAGGDYDVFWVVDQALDVRRKTFGWPEPDTGRAEVIVAPTERQIQTLANDQPSESTHIISGLHDASSGRHALPLLLPTRATLGLMSEAYDHRGWQGVFRRLRGTVDALRLSRRLDFLLPMGQLGRQWFARAGFPPEKLFPYGYFPESPESEEFNDGQAGNETVQLLFIGQYIPRKGVMVLLQALAGLEERGWQLRLIGEGDQREVLEIWGEGHHIADRMTFESAQPNAAVMHFLQRSDLLILPSLFDGWGAVVNEALLRGTPVICTDKCGAADLLRSSWRGEVVPAGSVTALCEALARWIRRGGQTVEERTRLRNWARAITGESAAAYLRQALAHVAGEGPRPTPPWYVDALQEHSV
ncbi:MAG: glycosyltransferase [Armatimonadota bacterium]